MGRKPIAFKDSDEFTLDEFAHLSPRSMTRVLKTMSPEHQNELIAECERRIYYALECGTRTGVAWTSDRGPSRFPTPYELHAYYSNLYTVLTGWMTKEDIALREEALFLAEDQTEAIKEAFRAKGWKVRS